MSQAKYLHEIGGMLIKMVSAGDESSQTSLFLANPKSGDSIELAQPFDRCRYGKIDG